MVLWQYVGLLATHWVADFVLQTHWQATNKSKRLDALALHVLAYISMLGIVSIVIFGVSVATVMFILANGMLHFVTDYATSRVSAKLYAKQDWHNFFVVIGFDQLIHQVTLAATMWVLF